MRGGGQEVVEEAKGGVGQVHLGPVEEEEVVEVGSSP